MSYIMAGVAVGGMAIQMAGAAQGASAARAAGRRQQQANAFVAAQMRQQAGQVVASSQRTAVEQERQATLLASRAVAVAAAGGGGVTDVGMRHIIGDIFGEGAYRASVALYQGKDKAQQLELGAEAKDYEGENAVLAANDKASAIMTQGIGSAIQTGASMFGKYGGGGPGTGSAGALTGNGWMDAGTPPFNPVA